MTFEMTEEKVLANCLHNSLETLENVFFPLFKDKLTIRTAPAVCGYMTPIYHQHVPDFEEWKHSRYQELRQSQYPPIEEQLDYIYHNGVEAWKAEIIDPVKETFPKRLSDV